MRHFEDSGDYNNGGRIRVADDNSRGGETDNAQSGRISGMESERQLHFMGLNSPFQTWWLAMYVHVKLLFLFLFVLHYIFTSNFINIIIIIIIIIMNFRFPFRQEILQCFGSEQNELRDVQWARLH